MSCSPDLKEQILVATAKAGVQQYNAIVYLLKADVHSKFKILDRLTRYENFLDERTIKNIFNDSL